jgi:hypothetical protein
MPFSRTEFMDMLVSYNHAVWPWQLVLLLACLFISLTALRGHRGGVRPVYLVLAMLWAWMGVVFHWTFFRPINPSAVVWAILFVLQALIFVVEAFRSPVLVRPSWAGTWFGLAALTYAVILYPILGEITGQHYPSAPTFGLPCPTTIATFGLLALLPVREARWLPIIPTVWAAIGSMAVAFGIYEDLGLPICALGYWLVQWHERGSPVSQYFQPGTSRTSPASSSMGTG